MHPGPSAYGLQSSASYDVWRLVYELAGILGVDPGPFTLRELTWMADGRSRETWNHTAAVLAMLANCHRDPKKTRPAKPSDFHPHDKLKRTSRHQKKPKVGVAVLKEIFVDRRPMSAR